MKLLGACTVAVLLVACGPAVRDSGGGDDGGGDDQATADAATEACDKIDFLFVIDNSGSMREEQENLTANAPMFAQAIDTYVTQSGELLDYRIAVVTAGRDVSYTIEIPGVLSIPYTEPGDNGVFRDTCTAPRKWIEKSDTDVAGKFACNADVGVTGPGAEMMLLGLEWSLNQRVADGTNAGFLRDDALLAIVIITDQDDCSREDDGFTIYGNRGTCYNPEDAQIIPIQHYLTFLDQLKGNRGRWASAVIAGLGTTPCTSAFGDAQPAVRMVDFATQAGENTVTSSICEGNLAPAIGQALGKFEQACNALPPIL